MVDERDDDEIFELTEEMASVPPPAAAPSEETEESSPTDDAVKRERRESGPPLRTSSPFIQIAEPRAREKVVIPDPDSKARSSKRPSFVPEKRDVAVLAVPIKKLSSDQGKKAGPPKRKEQGKKADETEIPKEATVEAKVEPVEEIKPPQIAEEMSVQVEPSTEHSAQTDEEIFDLGQELIAEAPGENAEPVREAETSAAAEAERTEEPAEVEQPAEPEAQAGVPEGAEEPEREEEEIEARPAEAEAPAEPEVVESEEGAEAAEAPGEVETAQAAAETEKVEAAEAEKAEAPEEEGGAEEIGEPASAEEIEEEIGDSDEQPEPAALDLGTPEAVFDSFGDDSEQAETSATGEEGEEEEEIDLDEAEDLTDAERTTALPDVPKPPPTTGPQMKMRRRRKQAREWWAEIFDDDYLTLLPPLSPRDVRREVDFIESNLNVTKGSLLLDLCCGDGHHAVGMARRGYRVVGVDLSLPMLARAGEMAQEAGQKINFIHGDMRDLGFDKTFDAVYCVGTSFGYFDEKTNFKVLEGVARALKPGAPFLLEVANRDHVIMNQPNLTWFEGNGSVCMEETTFNFVSSRLDSVRNLILGENTRQVKHDISMRLYSLHELGSILQNAGFVVSQVAGHISTPKAFFGADSALIIIVASRRA